MFIKGEVMKSDKVVIVTGASSGIGRATASLLAASGYMVYGTSRKDGSPSADGVVMNRLDVREDASVRSFVNEVFERQGRIDVLVNNAGYEIAGSIEETSLSEAREQFETNFFGAARMVHAVLPHMRRQQSGHIVNISSLSGLVGIPFHGYYSASKHALEGYSEALRFELIGHGINVSLVEPGFMRTNLEPSSHWVKGTIEDYSDARQKANKYFRNGSRAGDDPLLVARTIKKIIKNRSPRLRYKVGGVAVKVPRIKALVPERVFEKGLLRRMGLK